MIRNASAPSHAHRNAEHSRRAILEAAKHEFGELGVDGARIDSIARYAGVNKALLYYYFHDKESLYGAVLDDVFSARFQGLKAILDSDLAPGEKILRFARQHFDYVSGQDCFPRLVQYEIMRAARGTSRHLPRLIESFFAPLMREVTAIIHRGMAERQFRPVDPENLVLSIVGVNVFHVLSAPVRKGMSETQALVADSISERRAATLDFIAASIFSNRDEGIRLAASIVTEPAAPVVVMPAGGARPIRGKSRQPI
jgi:TetR/AcrR family transcriptional regulator